MGTIQKQPHTALPFTPSRLTTAFAPHKIHPNKIHLDCRCDRLRTVFKATNNLNPASSVQRPASSVQRPASSVQRPASSVQLDSLCGKVPAFFIIFTPSLCDGRFSLRAHYAQFLLG